MQVRLTIASKDGKKIKDKIMPLLDTVEDEDWSDEWELVGRVIVLFSYLTAL